MPAISGISDPSLQGMIDPRGMTMMGMNQQQTAKKTSPPRSSETSASTWSNSKQRFIHLFA